MSALRRSFVFRHLFCALAALCCALSLVATPAAAQSADPRWGFLAELAEHDFEYKILISTWRWKVPNQILAQTTWGLGGHRVTEYELDPATGTITMRLFYETRRSDFQSDTGWKAGPDRLLTGKGKIYLMKSDTGGYDWGSNTFRPITPGHQKQASVAKIVTSGKLRAANPDLLSTSQSAQAAQASAAPPVAERSDPRWGLFAEIVERDFQSNQGGIIAVRWRIPDKAIQVTEAAPANFGGMTLAKHTYVIEDIAGLQGEKHNRIRKFAVRSSGEAFFPGHQFALLRKDVNGDFIWDACSDSGCGRQLQAVGSAQKILTKIIARGDVLPANPASNASAQLMQTFETVVPTPAVTATSVAPLVAPVPNNSGPRLALVIGNSSYGASMGVLPNPANDADTMAAALRSLGFTVHLVKDADQKVMKRAIVRFGQRLTSAGRGATALFFYAGHGLQHRGTNYLVPINAEVSTQADIDIEAVAADTVLQQMEEAGAATNIVILDACRNMPLVRGFRSPTRGLAPMDAPNGSFIAYSTAPGSVAADGAGANSPFVTALVKNLGRKGESIESIFRDVRREVLTTTEGAQTPWDSSSLIQPFYFAGK